MAEEDRASNSSDQQPSNTQSSLQQPILASSPTPGPTPAPGPSASNASSQPQPSGPSTSAPPLSSSSQPSSSQPAPSTSPSPSPSPEPASTPQPVASSSPAPSPSPSPTPEPEPEPQPQSQSPTSQSPTPLPQSSSTPTTREPASSPAPTQAPSPTVSPFPAPSTSTKVFTSVAESYSVVPVVESVTSQRVLTSEVVATQVLTSNLIRPTTAPDGRQFTLTSFVQVTALRTLPTTVVSATVIAGITTSTHVPVSLNNGTASTSPSFFDNRGAVIGTFLGLAIALLAGLVGAGWFFATRRRARLRAAEEEDAARFAAPPPDDPHGLLGPAGISDEDMGEHDLYGSTETYVDRYPDQLPMHQLGMPAFGTRAGISSMGAQTMNMDDWTQYIAAHASTLPDNIDEEDHPGELVQVAESDPSEGHHAGTMAEFRMLNTPSGSGGHSGTDDRLEPSALLPYRTPSSGENEGYEERLSLKDENDYSRRILRVSNPDEDTRSSTASASQDEEHSDSDPPLPVYQQTQHSESHQPQSQLQQQEHKDGQDEDEESDRRSWRTGIEEINRK